jgi:hypothetical protein
MDIDDDDDLIVVSIANEGERIGYTTKILHIE